MSFTPITLYTLRMDDMGARLEPIAAQVARLARAADFLANGMSLLPCPVAAADRRASMPAKIIGNGLRELDIFLTDIIVEAGRLDRGGAAAGPDPGVRPSRRIHSSAEAWRRAAPALGLETSAGGRLRQIRARQNRMCFGRLRGDQAEAAMQAACADYRRLADAVLAALRARTPR